MGYEHLPQDDASDDAVDLVIESHELQRRRHIRTVLLKHGWTIINAVLLLTQLALITFYVRHIAIDQAPAVPTSYGRQFDYMSLDHQFDDLWGGEAIEKAGVIVLKEHGGRYNDIEYGAISMYARCCSD
ncbi:hypothetical protein PMZ80_003520 [Knufia obscura]|uniref:Uncharacterized protein n=2 Tax=Knufia TaxID=430999 RepID=A0AAN8I7V1_9EURO|nr:hypothetical protein PMZ80_003520 [Knufia obscura]KAK5958562.1 hypothetical protein OHC33_000405 [Knufia fluminis]